MRMNRIVFSLLVLVLLVSMVFAEELNTSSPVSCGELVYFCSEDSPYCSLVESEVDKFAEDPGCVEFTEYIVPSFMDLLEDSLALRYDVTYVPAFIFIDENGCFEEIGFGGSTKLMHMKNGTANFMCGESPSHRNKPTPPSALECPSYTCDDGLKPKCEIVDSQCSCESCPSIPLEPNFSTGPIEIPESENVQIIRYECGGCSLDKQCYPFGYRKNQTFCSDLDKQFTEQKKADSSCENNFECSTNLCIDDQCVSSGLLQRIFGWFGRLFG